MGSLAITSISRKEAFNSYPEGEGGKHDKLYFKIFKKILYILYDMDDIIFIILFVSKNTNATLFYNLSNHTSYFINALYAEW